MTGATKDFDYLNKRATYWKDTSQNIPELVGITIVKKSPFSFLSLESEQTLHFVHNVSLTLLP